MTTATMTKATEKKEQKIQQLQKEVIAAERAYNTYGGPRLFKDLKDSRKKLTTLRGW